jgi:hypothetical protein
MHGSVLALQCCDQHAAPHVAVYRSSSAAFSPTLAVPATTAATAAAATIATTHGVRRARFLPRWCLRVAACTPSSTIPFIFSFSFLTSPLCRERNVAKFIVRESEGPHGSIGDRVLEPVSRFGRAIRLHRCVEELEAI